MSAMLRHTLSIGHLHMTIEAFDPDQYLDATQSAVPATDFTPVPATDYPAHVKPSSVKVNLVPFREDAKTGVHLVKADGSTIFGGKELELYWVIDDPAVAESLGLQEAFVLERFELYREAPEKTSGWCHLQSVPPGSGKRTFYP